MHTWENQRQRNTKRMNLALESSSMEFESNERTTQSRGELANILRFILGKSHDEPFKLLSLPELRADEYA